MKWGVFKRLKLAQNALLCCDAETGTMEEKKGKGATGKGKMKERREEWAMLIGISLFFALDVRDVDGLLICVWPQ